MRVRLLLSSCVVFAGCASSDAKDSSELPLQATYPIVVQTPEFVVQPGEETTKCFYTSLPIDKEAPVARFESEMTNGSHHLIVFAMETASEPDGTGPPPSSRQYLVAIVTALIASNALPCGRYRCHLDVNT